MRKTTDIRLMRKEVETVKDNSTELLSVAVKYWNELALGYCIEHEELKSENGKYINDEKSFTVESIEDVLTECIYWLSCYYENGHCRKEDEYNDRKAFIKFLTVFLPYSNITRLYDIPSDKDTNSLSILFNIIKENKNKTVENKNSNVVTNSTENNQNAIENSKVESMKNTNNSAKTEKSNNPTINVVTTITDDKIFSICKKIMDSSTVEKIYPKKWYNKNGVLSVANFAKNDVDGINERLFNDCRKVSETQLKDKRVNAMVCFFKSMYETNKLVKGYEIGLNKLSNMFTSWTDGKYTFNLKDTVDLRIIGISVAIANLKGYTPSNLMMRIYTNRDNVTVIRVVDFIGGFYSWKVIKELNEDEKTEKSKKTIEDAINVILQNNNVLTNTEKLDLLKKIEESLQIKKCEVVKKSKIA